MIGTELLCNVKLTNILSNVTIPPILLLNLISLVSLHAYLSGTEAVLPKVGVHRPNVHLQTHIKARVR